MSCRRQQSRADRRDEIRSRTAFSSPTLTGGSAASIFGVTTAAGWSLQCEGDRQLGSLEHVPLSVFPSDVSVPSNRA